MPSFTVVFEEAAVGALFSGGIDDDHFSLIKYIHGNHIKGVMRDDVGDQEVDVVGGVGGAASVFVLHYVDGKTVGVVKARDGDALHLNPQHALAALEQEIVRTPVSKGPRWGEVQRRGLQNESHLGDFA